MAKPRSWRYYRIQHAGRPVVEPWLGVVLTGGDTLGVGLQVVSADSSLHDDTRTQPWGEVAQVRDHHRELRLGVQETSGTERRMDLVFRVFDDGIGTRPLLSRPFDLLSDHEQ